AGTEHGACAAVPGEAGLTEYAGGKGAAAAGTAGGSVRVRHGGDQAGSESDGGGERGRIKGSAEVCRGSVRGQHGGATAGPSQGGAGEYGEGWGAAGGGCVTAVGRGAAAGGGGVQRDGAELRGSGVYPRAV